MSRAVRVLGPMLLAAMLSSMTPAAQAQGTEKTEQKLQDVERARDNAETRVRDVEQRRAALRDEQQQLAGKLAEQAAAVRREERAVNEAEAALLEAGRQLEDRTARLQERRGELGTAVSALLGVARLPPLAAVAQSDGAAEAALAASALAGLTPMLQGRVESLRQEVVALESLRAARESARSQAVEALQRLSDERNMLQDLLADRRRSLEGLQVVQAIESARLSRLAREAKTLTALMDRLAPVTELAAVPDRPLDRVSVLQLKGRLPFPAEGRVMHRFGEHPPGSPADVQGVTVQTRSGALVTAPHDGTVRFAGPFRSYGRLLIIDLGDGYHLLVAGLAETDVEVGQWLLAGEPVGRMASTAELPAGRDRPELYLELRRDGTPVDPLPWLTAH